MPHIDGLVQEKRNSSALAMELRITCTNPSNYTLRHADSFTPVAYLSTKSTKV